MAGLLDAYDQASPGLLGPLGGGNGLLPGGSNTSNMLMAMGGALLGGGGWGGAVNAGMAARQAASNDAIRNLLLRHNLVKDARDFKFRASEGERAQRNADRTFDLQTRGFGLTDDIKEFNVAKQQGFPGSLEQWMQRKRAGAGDYGPQGIWGRSSLSIR